MCRLTTILFLFGSLLGVSCQQSNHQSAENEYQDSSNLVFATAPDATVPIQQGYALPGLDHGLIQSPINILACRTKDLDCHKVVLHYQQSKEKVVNLGHTIQLDYQPGSNVEYDDDIYNFKQFHFHTPPST